MDIFVRYDKIERNDRIAWDANVISTNAYAPAVADESSDCRALADILMCIGDKWTIMVVGALSQGPMRYSEIARKVDGVSQRMLTLTLRALERDGLIDRTVIPTKPVRVDYSLTARGHSLVVPLGALWYWAKDNRLAIEGSRHSFDRALE